VKAMITLKEKNIETCRNCGASLTVNLRESRIFCPYCETEYYRVTPKERELQKKERAMLIKKTLVAAASFIFLLIVSFVFMYNNISGKYESTIEYQNMVLIQFQRRDKLIPDIYETVNRYMTYEKTILLDFSKTMKVLSGFSAEKIQADSRKYLKEQKRITANISLLMKTVSRYPQIKADRLFVNLQTSIEGSENRIAVAKRNYVISVSAYNKAIGGFPSNIVAYIFGFRRQDNILQ
jgi:LemA protein